MRADPRRIAPEFLPAFRALEAAVAEGEDELASHIAAQLRVRSLGEDEVELLEAFERILFGRAIVASLSLELDREATEQGESRLVLYIQQDTPGTVTLRLPPADLEHLTVGIDRDGLEGRRFDSATTRVLTNLVLPPETRTRIELLTYSPSLGHGLALRELWRLDVRAGEIEVDGNLYPANQVPEARLERVIFDSSLPATLVTGEELAAAFADEKASLERVLELAVRVPPEERQDCMERLEPVVATLAEEEPDRLERLIPVLRWISRSGEPEANAEAWSAWLKTWVRRAESAPTQPQSSLMLPSRRPDR